MARPVRLHVAGGMYHVCARGHNREALFKDDADRRAFLRMLGEMRERHRVRVLAYCLMDNHYHLLIKTPEGNISRAMQWLNGRYGIWHSRRHKRLGHLFAGRFKSVLVEAEGWALETSLYIHRNPIATEALGLGKQEQARERQGLRPPRREDVVRRLRLLRGYRWSSYRAYAGYGPAPHWLDTGVVLERIAGGDKSHAGYRKMMEDRLRQGVDEPLESKMRWGVVLGGERFARKVRGKIVLKRESSGRRELRRARTFEEIVSDIERMAGSRWQDFKDLHGDIWRDVVLWSARHHGAMTLAEIGEKAGGLDYAAVFAAVKRLEHRAQKDRALLKIVRKLERKR